MPNVNLENLEIRKWQNQKPRLSLSRLITYVKHSVIPDGGGGINKDTDPLIDNQFTRYAGYRTHLSISRGPVAHLRGCRIAVGTAFSTQRLGCPRETMLAEERTPTPRGCLVDGRPVTPPTEPPYRAGRADNAATLDQSQL